jgi:hypothetical protein
MVRQPPVPAADHNSVESLDKTAVARPHVRPPDWKAIDDLLGLLARAVQQLHTYPASSPLCVSAVEACQRALAGFETRDQITFRVTPTELTVDDVPTGRGTQVGHELARRLHKASVAAVTIDRAATAREIGRFCEDLVRCGERGTTATLLEMMTEHGIDRVAVEMASRPEVLEVGAPAPTADEDIRRERARFDAQLAKGGFVNHLYPPQKGWVRLDPGAAPPSVSLLDLAVLADNPATLASMLLRLTDDAEDVEPSEALERKYSDVAMLISSLDPRVARRMFSKLARAVLDLEPQARQALLRRTVLPGLLDGRVDGAILRDFPDLDLSESLCLLLDIETAAPELLTTALSRLELPAERHAAIVPLLDAKLKEREAEAATGARQNTLARHARELMRIGSGERHFGEFAAFDLSMDQDATSTIDHIREAVPATDITATQLTCLWHLICLEPNPESVSRFLQRSFGLLAELERASRGAELPSWLSGYRDLATRLWEPRPDVATVITGHLAAFCTPERAVWLADLALCEPGGREAAGAVVDAVGPAVVAPLVELLESIAENTSGARSLQARSRAAAQLLTDHAARLAPAVVPLLEQTSAPTRRTLLRVLGSAGSGYEAPIAAQVSAGDEPTAREALRALARVGTAKAAALVVAEIERQRGVLSVAAEETLWHFPPPEAQRHTRELLARREFTMSHPQATERLLDRVARSGAADFEPVLLGLAPLRFRLWNPALARVARKAHGMLKPAVKPTMS